ncbi:phasin family protein [Luteimonas kalidii]|uniref:Phasin family protein n=1 Tax=Luteimonas kalidii TaxID=3042025 RepID=A0ABT6JV16_9GAMM|nr:phasin family protein [Luteimonas kalidii]MDH5834434.1 phasin family protein [Luteimonas kalidii]
MNYQYNEQFATATRQFADTAARINQLALENAHKVFGLQMATLEENAEATFSFFGEAAEVRDFDGMKTLFPKGVQIARENVERSISAGQEVFGSTVKTNEAIAEIAKSQLESATVKAQAEAEKVVASAAKTTKRR